MLGMRRINRIWCSHKKAGWLKILKSIAK
jgi:hypothetical protein